MRKQTREQIKAQLMAEAEEAIDDLLEWGEEVSAPTLAELEDVVLELRKRLGQRMGEIALRGQGTAQRVPGPSCPECGQEMQLSGSCHGLGFVARGPIYGEALKHPELKRFV